MRCISCGSPMEDFDAYCLVCGKKAAIDGEFPEIELDSEGDYTEDS